jgi:hypothetical protein
LVVVGLILVLAAIWAAVRLLDPDLREWRRYEAELRARPLVPDEELVAGYFGSGTIPDIPARVRRVFAEWMGYPADRLLPDDDFTFFWAELDGEPLIVSLEEEFGAVFPEADVATTRPTIRQVSALVQRLTFTTPEAT